MSQEANLQVSQLGWKRLRRALLVTAALAVSGASIVYALSGGRLLLDADGLITREHVAVSAPYDSIIRQVLVRPGDKVAAGQKIALVESATIARTLADLATERAKIATRISQLEGRGKVVKTLLPAAEEAQAQAANFLELLKQYKASRLAMPHTLQEAMAVYFTAVERLLSFRSEALTIDAELRDNKAAHQEVSNTYANLKLIHNDGVLVSPVDGYVGTDVGVVGALLSGNGKVSQVAKIFTGRSFALAYVSESYFFDVEEGQSVGIKARGQVHPATIEKVLPVTDALPPEFQLPNKARERGQLVRITLEDGDQFVLEQKVRVTSCFLPHCKDSFSGIVETLVPLIREAVHVIPAKLGAFDDDAKTLLVDLGGTIKRWVGDLGDTAAGITDKIAAWRRSAPVNNGVPKHADNVVAPAQADAKPVPVSAPAVRAETAPEPVASRANPAPVQAAPLPPRRYEPVNQHTSNARKFEAAHGKDAENAIFDRLGNKLVLSPAQRPKKPDTVAAARAGDLRAQIHALRI